MKNSKKLMLSIISFCLIIPVFSFNVFASEDTTQTIDISILPSYIESGSGTQEDPYIIDSSCPYKIIMDQQIQDIFSNQDNEIMLTSDFSGALSVKYNNTRYTNGGKWHCTGNIPSSSSDGICWIRNISYGSNSYIDELMTIRNTATWWTSLNTGILNVCGPDLVNYLVNTGVSTTVAAACGYLFLYTACIDVLNSVTYSYLSTTYNNGYGLLTVNYSISYHGDWYATSTVAQWTTYPYVYVPASYYGTGTFTSN